MHTTVAHHDSPQSGFPSGDTLPLDYGETQLLDHSVDLCSDARVQDWGRTQVLDDFHDTAVIQESDGEGLSERTEVVGDEGLVDDVGEVGSGFRSKDGDLVDPDASTDGEEGCVGDGAGDVSSSLHLTGSSYKSTIECPRKSFVDIRVAAVRSSGFAAAGRMTCMTPDKNSDSFNMEAEKYNKYNQEKAEDTPSGVKASSISELNIVGTKDGNVLDHYAENSFRHIDCYTSDNVLYQEQKTTIGSKRNAEKWSSPCPLICDHGAAGLSYISSQEPSAQSQGNALDVVDKFLTVNDLGLSQDINRGKTDMTKSPAIASRKRAECFARKCHRRSAGNMQAYEWIDFLEDEGGGELFSRRKNFFFNSRGKRRGSNRPPLEAKHGGYESAIGIDKSSNEGADKINEAVYDVGPATQMAAEAIQALGHGSPGKLNQNSLQLNSGELGIISTGIKKSKKTFSKDAPMHKSSSKSPTFEGIMTRSKRQSIYATSRMEINTSSRKQSSNMRMKMVLEEGTAEITSNMMMKKSEYSSEGVDSLNNGEFAASIIRDTVNDAVDSTFNEKVEMHPVQNMQPSFSGKCREGNTQYTSPVAHRTRSSKSAKMLKLDETVSDGPCNEIIRNNICAHRTFEVGDGTVSNVAAPKFNECGCNMALNGRTDTDNRIGGDVDMRGMEGVNVKEGTAYDKDAYREPKRMKMNQNISDNRQSGCKMDSHSKSVDIFASAVVKPSIQKRKHRVFIRSIAEILATVKRKKRSIFLGRKFDSDGFPCSNGLPSNEENMGKSGTGTRSSMISNILKFANVPHFKTQQLSYKHASNGNMCANSAGKQILHPNKPEKSKEAADSKLLSDVEKSINPEGSPNVLGQPGLPTSLLGTHAISPVYISQDTSTKSCQKSFSKSAISRELNRLEASETSLTQNYKDMRRRKDISRFQVCFSHHLSEDVIKQQKKTLARLGIQVVSSSSTATHFIADKFVRTRNMLEAMAMGKPVVTPMWIENCGQARHYIDEKNYILRDAKKEKEIGFSMPVSLARACQRSLLQGKRVFITPNTKPGLELISGIVKAADGQPLKRIGRSLMKEDTLPNNLLILSSEEDFEVCMPLLEKGAEVFSAELLLNGIVIQKLEYERHRLFVDHVKRTRSTMWLRGEDGNAFHLVKKRT